MLSLCLADFIVWPDYLWQQRCCCLRREESVLPGEEHWSGSARVQDIFSCVSSAPLAEHPTVSPAAGPAPPHLRCLLVFLPRWSALTRARPETTNQGLVLFCVNQSEISIVLCQPIRGEYLPGTPRHKHSCQSTECTAWSHVFAQTGSPSWRWY